MNKNQMWKKLHSDLRRAYLMRWKDLNVNMIICLSEWYSFIGMINGNSIKTFNELSYKEVKKMYDRVYDIVQPDYVVAIKYNIDVEKLYTLHIDSIQERRKIYQEERSAC